MPEEFNGRRVINGAYGTLYWDNEPIFEVKSINADVEIERSDVQVGIDLDSKMTGIKGTGSFTIYHVYTRQIKRLVDAYKKGIDTRSLLSVYNRDPDATGAQQERFNIGNVWFNKLTMAQFARGEINEKEFEFGFTVSDSDIAEGIY